MVSFILWGIVVISFFLSAVICSNLFEGELDLVKFLWGVFVTWGVMMCLATLIWFGMDTFYQGFISR